MANWPTQHLPALEQNILKYRAIEMVLVLFYVEDIKQTVLGAIRATMPGRIPPTARKKLQKAWKILISEQIITSSEKEDIERLIDLRNRIGHSIHELTLDLNRDRWSKDHKRFHNIQYDYSARKKLKSYCDALSDRLGQKFIMSISLAPLYFQPAENVYERELGRLERKINRLMQERRDQTSAINAEISKVALSLKGRMHPRHPANKTATGRLSPDGIRVCEALFDAGCTIPTVAHLMDLSQQTVRSRRAKWEQKNGGYGRRRGFGFIRSGLPSTHRCIPPGIKHMRSFQLASRGPRSRIPRI